MFLLPQYFQRLFAEKCPNGSAVGQGLTCMFSKQISGQSLNPFPHTAYLQQTTLKGYMRTFGKNMKA